MQEGKKMYNKMRDGRKVKAEFRAVK